MTRFASPRLFPLFELPAQLPERVDVETSGVASATSHQKVP
jgi:hypothetical protein